MINQSLTGVRFGSRVLDIECIAKSTGNSATRKEAAKSFTSAYLSILPFFDALDAKKISSCMYAVSDESASDTFLSVDDAGVTTYKKVRSSKESGIAVDDAGPYNQTKRSFDVKPVDSERITFAVELRDEEKKLPEITVLSKPGENPFSFLNKAILKGTEMFFSKMGVNPSSCEKSCSGGGCKGSGKCGGGTSSNRIETPIIGAGPTGFSGC